MNMFRLLPVLLLMPLASHAQSASLGNTKKVQTQQGGAPPPSSTFKKDPVSRLDAGAVLCPTELALQQHQAAVVAMLNGQDTSGGRGCRTIRVMTPVTIVNRHGPSSTEIRLTSTPEQTGWTDSAVRDGLQNGAAAAR